MKTRLKNVHSTSLFTRLEIFKTSEKKHSKQISSGRRHGERRRYNIYPSTALRFRQTNNSFAGEERPGWVRSFKRKLAIRRVRRGRNDRSETTRDAVTGRREIFAVVVDARVKIKARGRFVPAHTARVRVFDEYLPSDFISVDPHVFFSWDRTAKNYIRRTAFYESARDDDATFPCLRCRRKYV